MCCYEFFLVNIIFFGLVKKYYMVIMNYIFMNFVNNIDLLYINKILIKVYVVDKEKIKVYVNINSMVIC